MSYPGGYDTPNRPVLLGLCLVCPLPNAPENWPSWHLQSSLGTNNPSPVDGVERLQIPPGFDSLGGRYRGVGVGPGSPVSGRALMILTTRSNPTTQIRRREPEQFRQSIESWAKQGQEAGRDGDVELAASYPEDVADLRAILLTHRDWRTPRGGRGR